MINDKFFSDIQTKKNIFNNFFADQCQPSVFGFQRRGTKAHGHDDISIRMIKICDRSLLKPLIVLLRNSIKSSSYPDIWKKSNIIPVHKRIKNWLKTGTNLSFAIFGKIFKKKFINSI